MSLNRTWPSIGHVAGVSPAPLSRDSQAACFAIDHHGDRSVPGEVIQGKFLPPPPQLPHRVGVSVSQAGVAEAPERPLTVSPGSAPVGAPAHPVTPVLALPTTLLILNPASLFLDFEPGGIKLPRLCLV